MEKTIERIIPGIVFFILIVLFTAALTFSIIIIQNLFFEPSTEEKIVLSITPGSIIKIEALDGIKYYRVSKNDCAYNYKNEQKEERRGTLKDSIYFSDVCEDEKRIVLEGTEVTKRIRGILSGNLYGTSSDEFEDFKEELNSKHPAGNSGKKMTAIVQ